jgi:predicted dehydrogenase/nucleoside-diphosphate-sugar epimerase
VQLLHLPAMQALNWVDGSLALDVSAESLSRLRSIDSRLETRQGDYRQIFSESDLASQFDAALVSLPNGMHAEAVERALSAGLPVLCEKPLGMTAEECIHLEKVAEKSEKTLAVAMVMRFVPGLLAMRNALESGLVGEIVEVDAEDGSPFSWDSDSGGYFTKANGGVLLNMGVHYLDLLGWLFGSLEPISYQDDAEGGVEANFEYRFRARSALVRLEVSYSRNLRNSICVKGTEGVLIFDKSCPTECQWIRGKVRGRLCLTRPFQHGRWMPTMMASYAEQLAAFSLAVQRSGASLASASEAAISGRLIDWAGTHRTPINPSVGRAAVSIQARQSIKGRVVVTGATGFVGNRLLDALGQCQGVETIAAVRSFKNGANAGRFPVRQVRANLLDFASLCHAFKGARHVFHLAFGSDGPEARRTTIEGSVLACKAAIEVGAESIVVVGTTAVYGPSPDGIVVDEDWPLRKSGSAYELAKAEMVRQVLKLAKSGQTGSTRIVIIEPACVYGPGGKPFTEWPAQLARDGEFAWIENGRGVANLVHVDSLVDALLRAAAEPTAHGQRFIIQDFVTTWREYLEPLLGRFAVGMRTLTARELANPSASGLREVLKAVLRSPEVIEKVRNWTVLKKLRPWIERYAEGPVQKLRRIKDSKAVTSTTLRLEPEPGAITIRPAPAWLSGAYGPGSPTLSNEKAKRVLGWKPVVSQEDGRAQALVWLRYVRLREESLPQPPASEKAF